MISTRKLLVVVLSCLPCLAIANYQENHKSNCPGANCAEGQVLLIDWELTHTLKLMSVTKFDTANNKTPEAIKNLYLSEADLNTILPGSNSGMSGTGAANQPVAPQLHPTYEKWDVLRQYPRFVPVPPPQSQPPAVKPQESPKPSKEHQNA